MNRELVRDIVKVEQELENTRRSMEESLYTKGWA
jgi:hypothetical protein